MKTVDLNARLCRAAELAVRARIHLDCFIFLKSQENLDKFEDVLNIYWDFFRFDRLAHEWVFYVRISNLSTRKPTTDNLPESLCEMTKGGLLDQIKSDQCHGLLTEVNPIRKAIKHVRDKAVAHQDDALSQPQVNAKAKLSLPKLIKLSDVSLEIANCLCTARDLPSRQFFASHTNRLTAMLEALRA